MRIVRGSQKWSVVSGENGDIQQSLIVWEDVSQQRFDPSPPTSPRTTFNLFIVLFTNFMARTMYWARGETSYQFVLTPPTVLVL